MTRRYWVAAAGNWLGVPLALGAVAILVGADARYHALAGGLLYLVGFGTHRFMAVMDEEFHKSV